MCLSQIKTNMHSVDFCLISSHAVHQCCEQLELCRNLASGSRSMAAAGTAVSRRFYQQPSWLPSYLRVMGPPDASGARPMAPMLLELLKVRSLCVVGCYSLDWLACLACWGKRVDDGHLDSRGPRGHGKRLDDMLSGVDSESRLGKQVRISNCLSALLGRARHNLSWGPRSGR